MSIWHAIAAEARDDFTISLVFGLILTAALLRRSPQHERRRLRPMSIFLGLHLVSLPIVAALRAGGSSTYPDLRLISLACAAISGVGMVVAVLFVTVLPGLGVRAPQILRDLVGAGALLVALFVLASRAGLNLTGLIATSAVVTAVIGLALQDSLGNVIGGLVVQLDQSIRAGDWIKINDITGRVAEIRWRYTSIETRNWETLIIPNSVIVKNQVTVLGRRAGQPLQWRRWVYFNVDFRYPPSDVIPEVEKAIMAAPITRVAAEPRPNCILMDLQESYGRYAVRYWLTDLAADDPTDSEVRTRIYFALRRAKIPLSIPAHAVFMTKDSRGRREAKKQREIDRRVDVLEHIDLFRQLTDDQRRHLADHMLEAPFAEGETLTKQGAEAHWLYIISQGDVSVRVQAQGGLEREVAQLGPGNIFGEMSLMTGAPRTATVVALSDDVECFRLDKAAFREVLHDKPELAEKIAEILATRSTQLLSVRENLDHEAELRRMAETKDDLLGKIRDFFGLTGEP